MYNSNIMYPVDQFVVPQMQYDPNNPPFVPQLQVPTWVGQYIPYLSGLMADMITRGAVGPVSIHFYNHMVQNNWANNDFVTEINNCADFVYLKTANMNPNDIDPGKAFLQLVPAYLQLRSMFEVKIFGGLWQFINPQDKFAIEQDIGRFESEMSAIINLRQGGSGVRTAPMPGSVAGGRYPAPATGGYPNAQQPMQSAPYVAPIGVQGRAPGGGRDYGDTTPVVKAQPAPVAAPQPVKGNAMPPNQEGLVVEATTTKWNPADEFPYPLAYNPIKVKMLYQLTGGKTHPRPANNTDINMIDYDRHNIQTIFGKPPANLPVLRDNTEQMQDLRSGIADAVEEENDLDEKGARKNQHLGLNVVMTGFSLKSMILDARVERLAAIDKDLPPAIFQVYAKIYTPIIGEKSEYDIISKFGDSSTYIELREKIRTAGATASPELISEVNLSMTALVNSILHKNLGIPPDDLTVDDFCLDLDDLLTVLKKNYSTKFLNGFLKDQAMRIRAMFDAPDVTQEAGQTVHDNLASTLLSDVWENHTDKPAFTFFGTTVRLSLIDVLSHDLQLGGLHNVGNILLAKNNPELFELGKALFESDNNGMYIGRQLVVTKDGRILEISQASLVEGNTLVSLVK